MTEEPRLADEPYIGQMQAPEMGASVPELPFADDLLDLAAQDLEASRNLLQRLLSISEALLASTFTVAGLFGGLALSNESPSLALLAAPLVLAFGYLEAANWTHFRRVASRIRSLEHLMHAYVVALRETKTARPAAVTALSNQIDRYQFGIERTFVTPKLMDVWRTNRKRVRFWLFPGIAAVLVATSLWTARQPDNSPVCVALSDGSILRLDEPPTLTDSTTHLVACPLPPELPTGASTSGPATSDPGTSPIASAPSASSGP